MSTSETKTKNATAHPKDKDKDKDKDKNEDYRNVFTTYVCADCEATVQLKKHDIVRCSECGYRVLYKKRKAGNVVTYLAR